MVAFIGIYSVLIIRGTRFRTLEIPVHFTWTLLCINWSTCTVIAPLMSTIIDNGLEDETKVVKRWRDEVVLSFHTRRSSGRGYSL